MLRGPLLTSNAHDWTVAILLISSLGVASCGHRGAVGAPAPGSARDGVVVEQWNSALGEPCRRIQRELHYVGEVTVLECLDSGRWRRVRDLAGHGTDPALDGIPVSASEQEAP
ncbi:MAG: hypothetical protein ACFB6R_03775 [Alphaproteobacteria bacterium]